MTVVQAFTAALWMSPRETDTVLSVELFEPGIVSLDLGTSDIDGAAITVLDSKGIALRQHTIDFRSSTNGCIEMRGTAICLLRYIERNRKILHAISARLAKKSPVSQLPTYKYLGQQIVQILVGHNEEIAYRREEIQASLGASLGVLTLDRSQPFLSTNVLTDFVQRIKSTRNPVTTQQRPNTLQFVTNIHEQGNRHMLPIHRGRQVPILILLPAICHILTPMPAIAAECRAEFVFGLRRRPELQIDAESRF